MNMKGHKDILNDTNTLPALCLYPVCVTCLYPMCLYPISLSRSDSACFQPWPRLALAVALDRYIIVPRV